MYLTLILKPALCPLLPEDALRVIVDDAPVQVIATQARGAGGSLPVVAVHCSRASADKVWSASAAQVVCRPIVPKANSRNSARESIVHNRHIP